MKGSGSSTIRMRNRRPRMALRSARRKTSQTFEITGRALERRIHWKNDSRERDRNKETYQILMGRGHKQRRDHFSKRVTHRHAIKRDNVAS